MSGAPPLHRSLLRAALLGPLVALLPALLLVQLLAGDYTLPGGSLAAFALIFVGAAGWIAVLVLLGDRASAGSRLRRALFVLAGPVIVPLPLLTLTIQVEHQRFGRDAAWRTPALALDALTRAERPPGVALLLASLVPFAAILTTRALAVRRPLWAHALVIGVAGYASLLLLEHLTSDVLLPRELGRHALLPGGMALALLLLFAEARLARSRRESLRALAGPAPPRSRGVVRDMAVVVAVLAATLAASTWVYPLHFRWRLERRARNGEANALERLLGTPEDLYRALDSPWPLERAAAFELAARTDDAFGLLALVDDGQVKLRAVPAAHSDPHPLVRARATAVLALEQGALYELKPLARDPEPGVRFWARLGLALRATQTFPGSEAFPLLEALDGEERRALGWRLVQLGPGRLLPDLAELALLALATSGSSDARDDLSRVARYMAAVGVLPAPSPELACAIGPLVAGVDRSTLTPELVALAGLDGPP